MRLVALAVVVAAPFGGCAQYKLRTPSDDPVETTAYTQVTSHAFFWGLVYDPEVQTVNSVDGINDVIVEDNLGYDIISVITLGIWKPMTIKYRPRLPLGQQPVLFPVPDETTDDSDDSRDTEP
jgi:hypothetical protein